jgi:uncharacterized membrane protein
MKAESVHAALLLLVIAGLGLATFATLESSIPALQNSCSVSAFFSCHAVDTSGHTMIAWVPDWSIGLGGFLVLLALEIPLFRTWRRDLLTGVVAVSGLGLLVSVYLGYVELDVIHALCPICFSTYVVDGLVFLLSLWLFWTGRSKPGAAPDEDPSQPSPATDD